MQKTKPMPDAAEHIAKLKPEFVARYKEICPDYERFIDYSFSFLRRSIRVNTIKIKVKELKSRLEKEWALEQIPWCKEGSWIEHKKGARRDVGNLIEHSLGYFYVQEAASMIPPIVLAPKPGELVLDMCAAPGSKASQIAAMMRNRGLLVANDVKTARIKALGINLQRMGVMNAVITLMPGYAFKGFEFDRILVDAPCSGTGAIRKSLKTVAMWNPRMIKRLAGLQRRLLFTAFENLKEEGILVYSTCSLEPEENEGVVDSLLQRYDNAKLCKINLRIKRSPAILEFGKKVYSSELKKCLRIWPYDNDTEGFFVAKVLKC